MRELERSLKSMCEEFIMLVTKLVVDPVLSLVTKVTAVKVALSLGNQNQKVESAIAKPLKDQAFATPEKVSELVLKVSSAIQQELPNAMAKMKLYLQNPPARAILFKPNKHDIFSLNTSKLFSTYDFSWLDGHLTQSFGWCGKERLREWGM